jgi:O-antigen ligase
LTVAILSIVWTLWPLLAFAGGLGFAPLSFIAVLLIPASFRNLRLQFDMAPLAAFFALAAGSIAWSPRPVELSDISFTEHRFDISSDVTSVGLLFGAIAVMMAAARGLSDSDRRRVNTFACVALLVQLVVVGLLSAFETQALELFAPLMPSPDEGVQNISRNSLIMAVAAPTLVLLLAQGRHWLFGGFAGAAAIAAIAAALAVREVYAGVAALAAAGMAVGIVIAFRRNGFRILAAIIALVILAAPAIFGLLSQGADASLADDTVSYRLAIWQRVGEVIAEHPLIGGGLGVLREIKEIIPSGEFAGQLLVPNHAHNMLLQLWADTGAAGAGLLALSILLAGWRMPAPSELGNAGWRAAAIAGAFAATACVSFDLWNEWWWAVAGYLAILAVAHTRRQDKPQTSPEGRAQ